MPVSTLDMEDSEQFHTTMPSSATTTAATTAAASLSSTPTTVTALGDIEMGGFDRTAAGKGGVLPGLPGGGMPPSMEWA